MSNEHIIRAWKDAEYRMSLSEEDRAHLPEHPAGLIELTDAEMGIVGGGFLSIWSCEPTPHTEQQFCTTPCSTSLACPSGCGGGGYGSDEIESI